MVGGFKKKANIERPTAERNSAALQKGRAKKGVKPWDCMQKKKKRQGEENNVVRMLEKSSVTANSARENREPEKCQ